MAEIKKIELYNSLTKKKGTFEPIEDGIVKMYSCGPTVYDNPHIGNLATFIRDDLLKRALKAAGYKVKHVMNITDVDDKTIRDSKKEEFLVEGDEMASLLNLTAKFGKIFQDDIRKIGNDVDSIEFISATDTIAEMITLTNKLLANGVAYRASDGIYFSIGEYLASGKRYGLLQKLDLGQSRSRIDNDEYEKDSAADFALWKAKSEGEPAWEAEFEDAEGEFSMAGRPGWHIECSAMSEKLLGVPFDIHTGGIDLKFPHHENEIAQSCGASGKDSFANYFVHMSHILVEGRKMAKSAKNFYTLRDIEERGFDPMAFRLLVLSGHYRSEINFSWEILEAAQNRLKNWQAIADLRWQLPTDGYGLDASYHREEILDTLVEDLNTPVALVTFEKTLEGLRQDFFDSAADLTFEEFTKFIEVAKDLFGLDLLKPDISDQQKDVLAERQKARDGKDFAESDRLRDELEEQGLEVRDTENGQIWSRI